MYKVRREWTIREVELDPSILRSRAGLLRWFALSLGLINENDSREGIIILLDALFTYWFSLGKEPRFEDIKHHVAKKYLERGLKPPSDEAIRHHIRKLIKLGLVERREGHYVLLTDPLRPEDPTSALDVVFDRIVEVKKIIKMGFSHLKNLYS